MASITEVFLSSILPIVVIISLGFGLSQRQEIRTDSLNTLTLYILTPSLIFHSIALTELEATALLKITVGVVAFLSVVVLVSFAFGRGTGKEGAHLSAFMLIAVFGNTGGLGIPLADFAFGSLGRQTAVLFAAIHGAVVFTVGLFIASRSGGGSARGSLRRVFRYPLVYAVIAAVGIRFLGVAPAADSVAMRTIGLLGDSAIPVMLIILGVQLSRTEYRSALPMTTTPIAFRFGVSPLAGLLVASLLGFQNSTVAQVFVLLTAMPVAIGPIIFVVEFAQEARVDGVSLPELVSASIFVTTLLSIPLVTAIVVLLKSGLII
ncbi:permease [Salinigranum rubrum]|uniref:Permease n=1 Tax=Salinigranum rubrum TaxID=755307 RepID=A0A2I8VR08_9EURY|nr:AEC family transporter [Salinigranum rubrum]AUV83589.1 permease [Salinigranum rubrum]